MRILFTLIALAVWSVSPCRAAPIIGSYDYSPVGAPAGTGKMVLQLTIVVDGNPVTKTVTIPSGDIKPYPASGICAPADTDAQCAQKIADARGAASQAKATVIAKAINTTFAAEFKALGQTVTTGNTDVTKTITARGTNFTNIMATYGALVIPGVADNQKSPVVIKENGVLGEGGNGGKFIKPAGPSPGARGSLQRIDPGVQTAATGTDPAGDPSEVEFGLDGTYVADINPIPGMTDVQVLQALAFLLNTNGVPATYDATDVDLFLNNPIPDGTQLDWGNTDPGLNFTMTFEGLGPPIPEPPGWPLLLLAFLSLPVLRARRR